MAKKTKTKQRSKTAVNKRASENRAFRKLSNTFATKLGVVEQQQQQQNQNTHSRPLPVVLPRPCGNSALKRTLRNREKVAAAAAGSHSESEQSEFDRSYANLVEREHARSRTLIRSKKQRSKKERKEAAAKKRQQHHHQQQSPRNTALPTNSAKTGVGVRLQFQPATFSLEKSTTDLVNEATVTLNGVALREGGGAATTTAVVVVPVPQQNQLYVPSAWNHTNPNHTTNTLTTTTTTSNPFQSLHVEEDDDAAMQQQQLLQPQPAASFAFQPASFTVHSVATTATTTAPPDLADMIDPDL